MRQALFLDSVSRLLVPIGRQAVPRGEVTVLVVSYCSSRAAPIVPENFDEVVAGELTARIGVEDLRPAILGDCLVECLDTEFRSLGGRHPMRQQITGCQNDDGDQIEEAPAHGEVVHRQG